MIMIKDMEERLTFHPSAPKLLQCRPDFASFSCNKKHICIYLFSSEAFLFLSNINMDTKG